MATVTAQCEQIRHHPLMPLKLFPIDRNQRRTPHLTPIAITSAQRSICHQPSKKYSDFGTASKRIKIIRLAQLSPFHPPLATPSRLTKQQSTIVGEQTGAAAAGGGEEGERCRRRSESVSAVHFFDEFFSCCHAFILSSHHVFSSCTLNAA